MSPRLQRALFIILIVASLVMGGLLWWQLNRAHQRLLDGEDSAPTEAPQVAPSEQATLLVANDFDNALQPQKYSLPLPADPGSRSRVILGKLLDLYAASGSSHPVTGGSGAVLQVFLLPVPQTAAAKTPPAKPVAAQDPLATAPLLAVVNLSGAFAASHPSGISVETLTVLSIAGTLRANLPRISEVRFLVDGHTRPTLAGHADLTRTYLPADVTASESARK